LIINEAMGRLMEEIRGDPPTTKLETFEPRRPWASGQASPSPAASRGRFSRAVSARQLLITALCGLLVAGVFTVVQLRADDASGASNAQDSAARRATVVFGSAWRGDCLTWPDNSPDRPSFVLCRDDHLFEVAQSVDMRNFQEPCQQTVQHYLGNRYDPNSRFTTTVLWPGDAAGPQPTDRHLLCGLQLLGPNGQPVPFKGRVADLDQSKVWPVGTCLGFDSATNRPTDIPVDCSQPHVEEVTGTVDLAVKFPDGPPAAQDQSAFIGDVCKQMTDIYLAPVALDSTPLRLHYGTVSPESWSAGSRKVACRIGELRDDQTWATLIGGAKGPVAVNGPAAPPPGPPAPPPPPPPPPPTSEPPTTSAPPTSAPAPPPTAVTTAPPAVTTNVAPSVTTTVAPAVTTTVAPAPPTTTAPSPPPPPPPPPTPTETTPPANVIEIPGLPPITLPGPPPPAPPPPA
jgi:Septum formation